MRDLANPFRTIHGTLRDAEATAFAVVKDEMYYIRSFLDHHRRLGIDQFIILDDQSTDGTRELLLSQPDCLVLESPFRFGEQVVVPGPGPERRERAGILFKSLIPQRFLANRYALYLDADEYLVLPTGLASVVELFDVLARNDVVSVAANLIDYFPATVTEMDVPRDLPTSGDMLGAHAYFDALPLLGWRPGNEWPRRLNETSTARLFRKHHVKDLPNALMRAPRWLKRMLPYRYPGPSVSKTPVVRWDPGVEYANSHWSNVPPTNRVLLGLAHMKFTYDLSRRADFALESRAYVRASRKYASYKELLECMRHGDPSFCGPETMRYTGPADLAAAGLTKLDLG
jgi:Glycosyl transferase family 2